MNSPLVIEQVRNVVNRPQFKNRTTDEERIRYLYQLFFQRLPLEEEIRDGKEFVAAHGQPEKTVSADSQLRPVSNLIGPGDRRRRRPGQSPSSSARKPLNGWQEYAHALLLTNEASFVN
jgi:hypothetical protein